MNFLNILDRYHVPTTSYREAVNYVNEQEVSHGELSGEEYRIRIIELTSLGDNLSDKVAKWTYKYIIQEAIRAYGNTKLPVNMAEIYNISVTKAEYFIANTLHSDVRAEAEPKVDANGKVKKKRGVKKELTCKLWAERSGDNLSRKEWIELLMEEVELTKAGASTYYAQLKNGSFGC